MSIFLNQPQSDDHIAAHRHCTRNRAELERSKLCGCFYCMDIYSPQEIHDWIDDDQTALCAKCPVDSVIGDVSGYPITVEFLKRMNSHWF